MAPRAYDVVFRNVYTQKVQSGYRSEITEYAYLFNSYYNAAGDNASARSTRINFAPDGGAGTALSRIDRSHIDDLLSGADEKLLDEIDRSWFSAFIMNNNIRSC